MAPRNKVIETAPAVLQAPDTPTSGTASGGDTEVVKQRVAKHELLNSAGEVVENEEEATGIRYTLMANNQSFDFQSGLNAGERNTMLAIFGAKTLATNESSAMRNSPKGEATADEQMDAVHERFALLETGKWVDRTRDGVGAKVDLDVLANAICNVQVAQGKYTEAEVKTDKMAKTRAMLEDKTKVAQARKVPAFAAEYARLKGAVAVSADDFVV